MPDLVTLNPTCASPNVLQSQQFLTLTQQNGNGTSQSGVTPTPPLYPNGRVVNMFFGGTLVPPKNLVGKLYGFSWLGNNGIYFASSTFSSSTRISPQVDVLAHEIGHVLGLDHTDVYNYNTQAPKLDLMTAGISRTVPGSTTSALSQLGAGGGAGTADQLDSSSTQNAGTSFQQSEVGTSGFLNPKPLATTNVGDPPGSDLVTFSTTGATYNGPVPTGWPTNVTLIGLTVTLSSGVKFDPLHPVAFTKNTAYNNYFSSYSYATGATCPGAANAQCLVITLKGLPGSGGSLIFTNGILLSAPPPPPGSNLTDQMAARGVYITYKFSDGSVISGQLTGSAATGGVMTNSQQFTTSTIPAQVNPTQLNTFMKTVKNPPPGCSPGVDPNIVGSNKKLANGCPDPKKVGSRDGDPRLEAGQSASPAIASCLAASSLGVLLQKPNVTVYVPNGSWAGSVSGSPGLQAVPLEPTQTS